MKKILLTVFALASIFTAKADEGMWCLNNLPPSAVQMMRELGLQLTEEQLYSADAPSLKDAVVSFGGFCTGVVVSPDGLVFTNHHCGFGSIQKHSSTEHDYLKDGFIAKTRAEELPNPSLFVNFLQYTIDVTSRVLNVLPTDIDEQKRTIMIDSICMDIQNEAIRGNDKLTAEVSPYFDGNAYYLSVYKTYTDVRLVFAPPSSIGKFGGDTDNWMWPRHTGDFSVFRIYADENNEPADYSETNRPFKPVKYAPISLKGYEPGSFSMTIGYPGSTTRYLSSYGIQERMTGMNAAMIQVRGLKQSIWTEAMNRDEATRIKYASKFASSSNYWKNSIGMNNSIEKLDIIGQKQQKEKALTEWLAKNPEKMAKFGQIIPVLEKAYEKRGKVNRSFYFLYESFFNSSDLLKQARKLLTTDFEGEDGKEAKASVLAAYKDIDVALDKKVLTAMIKNYREQTAGDSLAQIESLEKMIGENNMSVEQIVDGLYNTKLATEDGAALLIDSLADKKVNPCLNDPMVAFSIELISTVQTIRGSVVEESEQIQKNERLLNAALREMDQSRPYYSDANSTMRMSFGTVESYTMENGKNSGVYCTPKGLLNKVDHANGNQDYFLQDEITVQMRSGKFGKYKDKKSKTMQLCFLTTNDITGGNSGSPVFNGNGELIGLAFDGNWEAMSSDIAFNTKYQRCISVDIRYVLYMMDKWGNAKSLMKELAGK